MCVGIPAVCAYQRLLADCNTNLDNALIMAPDPWDLGVAELP